MDKPNQQGPATGVLQPVQAPERPEEVAADNQRLKTESVRGVAVNVGAEGGKFVLRFSYQIAMARLLLPADFGLVAMAAPAIAFVQMFADLGLTEATIQRKDINESQLSFLFWINLAMGALLGAACFAIAPLVAWFYHEPRAAGVMMATGGILLLGGLFSQHQALLTRHMRFRALAVLDLGSFAIGIAAGVTSAELGAGYWAILISQGVSSVASIVIAWSVTRWVPCRPGRTADMKAMLRFGGNITAFRVMNFFSHNSDSILLGKYGGEFALGLYNRAFKITLLPFTQLCVPFTKVAIPLLSRSQDRPDFYRRAYSRMLEALLLLLYPGLIFLLVNSSSVVWLALGPRWAGVAPIFHYLGIDAFVAPLAYSMGWLFVSQGRTRELRDWSVPTSILFITAFVIGLRWGAEGIAAGYASAAVGEMSFLWRIATRSGPLRGRDFWGLLLPFIFATAITFAAALGAARVLPRGWAGLPPSLLLCYALFLASLAMLPRGRALLRDLMQQGMERLQSLRRATAAGATTIVAEGQ